MSLIPQVDSCRFLSIPEINFRIAQDNFTYKSVRVYGKLKVLQDPITGYAVIDFPDTSGTASLESSNPELFVDIYALKNQQL